MGKYDGKAIIEVLDTKEIINVMFNPSEYTVLIESVLSDEKPRPLFNEVTLKDFTIKLIFDTYEKKTDVRELTNKIAKLLIPTVEGQTKKTAPVCLFVWGNFTYKGVIYKLNQKFTLFLSTGMPVRAELDVTFKAYVTPEEYAKNMGIEACRKVWTVKSGDRLDLIANKALKDPALWRKIADENNINNPMAFPEESDIGRILIIPDNS